MTRKLESWPGLWVEGGKASCEFRFKFRQGVLGIFHPGNQHQKKPVTNHVCPIDADEKLLWKNIPSTRFAQDSH